MNIAWKWSWKGHCVQPWFWQLMWHKCFVCPVLWAYFSDLVSLWRVVVLCSSSLHGRGSQGECCGLHFMKTHYDLLVTASPSIDIIQLLSSQFVHVCGICWGGFHSSPPRIGCMSSFKYCKGFSLVKVIKKKKPPKHSETHLFSKVALDHTSALQHSFCLWKYLAEVVCLRYHRRQTVPFPKRKKKRSLNRQDFIYSNLQRVQSKASAHTRP